MKKTNKNASSASSAQSSAAFTLSNKEQKTLTNWIADIYNNLKSPGSKSLETLLANYAAKNEGRGAQILARALTTNEIFKDGSKNEKVTLVHFAVLHAMISPEISERERMRDGIKKMLPYCAGLLPLESHPVVLLFENSEEYNKIRIRHSFVEILRLFLDYPEIYEIKGKTYLSNIIHYSAIFPCGSLFLLLDKRPDLINSTSLTGGTPLLSAIQYKQTQNAIKMIEERNPDLTLRNSQGNGVLASALAMNDYEVTATLLKQGCPIDAERNYLLSYTPAMIKLLSKSGYFLPGGHVENVPEILEMISNHSSPDVFSLGFFCLESADGKSHEYISTPEEVRNTKIIPSTSQIKRLHQSFLEVILYQDQSEDESLESCHINQLYSAFKLKFPNHDNVKLQITAIPAAPVEKQNINSLPVIMNTVIIANQMIAQSDLFLSNAKNIFLEENNNPSSTSVVKSSIIVFHETVEKLEKELKKIPSDNIAPYADFFYKLNYQYLHKIILPFVLRATKPEIEEIINPINYLIISSTVHVSNKNEKTLHSLIKTIDQIADRLKDVGISSHQVLELKLLANTYKISFYSECEFYNELCEVIEDIKGFGTLFTKTEYHDNIINHTTCTITNSLALIPNTPNQIDIKLKVIDVFESFLMTLSKKRSDLRESLAFASSKIEQKREIMESLRMEILKKLSNNNAAIYQFGEINERRIKIIFDDKLFSTVALSLMSKQLKLIGVQGNASTGYYIAHKDLSLDEIYHAIDALNHIKPEDLTVSRNDSNLDVAETLGQQPSSTSPFQVETNPNAYIIRQPVRKGKNKVDHSPVVTAMEPGIDLALIIAQIRAALKLPNTAEFFHIDHPGFPKAREHLCFGLWGDISGKNVNEVPQQVMKFHHDLAVTGKVVTHAYGQNGLKPTKVRNAAGELVDGLKTKNSAHDLRINSAPVKVNMKSGEQALLYVFGVVTKHKEDAPKIDTAAIIAGLSL